jgi:CHAD domain-containing protein
MKWLKRAIGRERRALERARRRFIAKRTEERLHAVRTTGRRLRSLLEDVAGLQPDPKLLRRVKRAAAATDAARDAAILFRLLDSSATGDERGFASPLLDELRLREEKATQMAHRRLARTRFAE